MNHEIAAAGIRRTRLWVYGLSSSAQLSHRWTGAVRKLRYIATVPVNGKSSRRPVARPGLADLGMHRAGVDRTFRRGLRRGRLCSMPDIGCWIGFELAVAASGTEEIRLSLMDCAMLGRSRIDGHAADRVFHILPRSMGMAVVVWMVIVLMTGVTLMICHGSPPCSLPPTLPMHERPAGSRRPPAISRRDPRLAYIQLPRRSI